MKTLLSILLVSCFAWGAPEKRAGFEFDTVGKIAIQERGRMKPLDTFARESVQFVTGKTNYQGMNPVEVIFGWLIAFDKEWENEKIVRVDYGPLKERLKLNKEDHFFTVSEIRDNAELQSMGREIMQKEQRKEALTEIEKKAGDLQAKKGLVEAIITGQILTIIPNPEGIHQNWFSLVQLTDRERLPFENAQVADLGLGLRSLVEAFMKKDAAAWSEASRKLSSVLRDNLGKQAYPSVSTLDTEIHYNHLRPFRWAWVFYSAAFVFLLFTLFGKSPVFKYLSGLFLVLGTGTHIYGFALRCWIAGRPPVTNMYESVIWVSLGCVVFALFIWGAYRNAAIPAAASVFAVVALVLADNLPFVLDPSIQPLEPVLRSNFWLTIHVLTITLSYAAFALSLCLGNVVLINYITQPKNTERIQQYCLYMYRAMQIGVVLLAAGTILGGVWADYSWGRFWGWDPKEVWALIALLLYLAVLHGRFAGWLKGFGFVAATVVSFLGVLMAWYGVNFVLGVGLHSYGFGSGGMSYVAAYVALQVAFILVAYVRYQAHRPAVEPSIFPKK